MTLTLRRPTVPVQWLIPLLVVNLFIISLGLSIGNYPSTKLLQDIICKHHLGLTLDDLLPESQCHNKAVQRELNIVEIGGAVSGTLAGTLCSHSILTISFPCITLTLVNRSSGISPARYASRQSWSCAHPSSELVKLVPLRELLPTHLLVVAIYSPASHMGLRRYHAHRWRTRSRRSHGLHQYLRRNLRVKTVSQTFLPLSCPIHAFANPSSFANLEQRASNG